MCDIEKLDFSLSVAGNRTFIDGNDLKHNIFNRLPLLKNFSWNIVSQIKFDNQTNFITSEDVQRTFEDFPNGLDMVMDYQFVRKVTRNFRRNSTRTNCAKIRFISFYRKLPYPEHMKDYFPFAKIP